MPQNAYLLAKIGADTAENERNFAEICLVLRAAHREAEERRHLVAHGAGADRALSVIFSVAIMRPS